VTGKEGEIFNQEQSLGHFLGSLARNSQKLGNFKKLSPLNGQ